MTCQKGPSCFKREALVSSVLALLIVLVARVAPASVPLACRQTHGVSLIRGAAGAPEKLQLQNEKVTRRSRPANATSPEPTRWKVKDGPLIDVMTTSENQERREERAAWVKAPYFDPTGPGVGRLGPNMPSDVPGQGSWVAITSSQAMWPTGMSAFFMRHCPAPTLDLGRMADVVSLLRGRLRTLTFRVLASPQRGVLHEAIPGILP